MDDFQSLVEAHFSLLRRVQTDAGANTASYTMGTEGISLRGEVDGD
jgi:hypothetical protein